MDNQFIRSMVFARKPYYSKVFNRMHDTTRMTVKWDIWLPAKLLFSGSADRRMLWASVKEEL